MGYRSAEDNSQLSTPLVEPTLWVGSTNAGGAEFHTCTVYATYWVKAKLEAKRKLNTSEVNVRPLHYESR